MNIDKPAVRERLTKFDFTGLFTQELGWDFPASNLTVRVNDQEFPLLSIAEKRGIQVLLCSPAADGRIPDYAMRRKIEKQVAKSAYEHLVIFIDQAKTVQIWQWVAREPGQPAKYREHQYHPGHQSGDALIQKLAHIYIPLSEEEALDLTGATHRLRDAFDRDRVTKKFYDRFKTEHAAFLLFIKGITEQADKEWYASLMLNRLMFVYFIQRKGFLDDDVDYLRNRLRKVQLTRGRGKFLTFYSYFLRVLFREGFAKEPRDRELDADLSALLGRVPYLNGGLFDVHELEERNTKLDIPDEAFERLFAFFDDWDWHLDARPLRNDREINPDVLGYIFEKYINQKQMGAYYTKEDITEYISKSTIIPFLFDVAKKKRAAAFEHGSQLWRFLSDDPDRYIYPALRHGLFDANGQEIPLPDAIAEGVTDVSKRGGWNRPAAKSHALPTETWREHVARRQRCLEVRERLRRGEVHEINDMITLNLDLRQFAQDAISGCEEPELLRAFWHAIHDVTVLDPTCGSGAFLFAALGILQPLYEACLDRMQGLVDDLDSSGERHSPRKFEDMRAVLADVARHPNRESFVLKSLIVRNLYGVDIMEEAVEICKLRLFLKLVAQVDTAGQLEPLPDIDFNIRPGNTLVGFTKLDEVKSSLERKHSATETIKLMPGFEESDQVTRIVEDAECVDRAYRRFHEMQTEHAMTGREFSAAKRELRERLDTLVQQLDRFMAGEYGIDVDTKPKEFSKWRDSHDPYHWFAEFFGIMSRGGFDVIVGNPPYVEYSEVRRIYQVNHLQTEVCGNLYAMCIERAYQMLRSGGRFGFIVQAPLISTRRMNAARSLLKSGSRILLVSTFDDRPAKLFDGMHHCRLAIVLAEKRRSDSPASAQVGTTRYYKWYKEERPFLFPCLAYQMLPEEATDDIIPKFRSDTEVAAYAKVLANRKTVGDMIAAGPTKHQVFYKITGVGHWFTFTLRSPKFWRAGNEESSTRENAASFPTKTARDSAYCCLCSSLHYWLYQARTNCRDFNPSDLEFMPIPDEAFDGVPEFSHLATRVMARLTETSEVREANYKVGGAVRFEKFRPKFTKDLLDQVDRTLGQYYGLDDSELDFVINYDIKYRMGEGAEEDDE